MFSLKNTLGALTLVAIAAPAVAQTGQIAQPLRSTGTFEVTVTNASKLRFTPVLVATHNANIGFFNVGSPASDQLALLAEGGAVGPLAGVLEGSDDVADVQSTQGLLEPGQSVTVQIEADRTSRRLSLAAMLLPTNDTFVALNSIVLPNAISQVTRVVALGYDAGSEPNDELCANIPGPPCGGEGDTPDAGGEGYVSISAGIQGVGDVSPAAYDWRNPVAIVTITRVQ
ncbi:MAG: spondin domain-containing protein [Gammaproteobacteria bacterium]